MYYLCNVISNEAITKKSKSLIMENIFTKKERINKLVYHCMTKIDTSQIVKDQKGNIATIQEDGSLNCNLFGTDIMSLSTLGMIRLRKERQNLK